MTSTSWKGGSGGWSTAGDWTGGIPNATIVDATIAAAGTYLVTIGAAAHFSADSVTIDESTATLDVLGSLTLGGSLAALTVNAGVFELGGTLVNGTVAVENGSTFMDEGGKISGTTAFSLAGDGSLDLNGHNLSIAGPAQVLGHVVGAGNLILGDAELNTAVIESGATLVDAGSIEQNSYVGFGGSGADIAALTINVGATYDIVSDANINASGTAAIVNHGLFEKTAVTGSSTIDPSFTNTATGTINAAAGILALNGGGSLAGILAGHEIDLDSNTYNLASAALKVGSLAVSSSDIVLGIGQSDAGSFSLYDSTVNLNGHNLTLSGHSSFSESFGNDSIAGAGTLVISGTADAQPQFEGQGLFFTGGAVLDVTGTLLAEGQILLGNSSSDSAAISIAKGGVYDFMNGNGISANGAVSIANAGLFEKTGLDGVGQIAASFTNTGTINAAAGTLQFDGGGSLAGTLTGREIDLDDTTYTLAAAAIVSVASLTVANGDIVLGGSRNYAGNFTLSDNFGTATVNLNGNNLTLSGNSSFSEYFGAGTISGAGTLLVSGATDAHAGFESQGLFLTGGAVLDVTGTLIQEGQLDLGNSSSDTATLTIASSATYDILSNGGINLDGTASVINAGLFERTGDTGTSDINASFTNTGTILVTAGTIDAASLSNNALVSVVNAGFIAGTVAGFGTFDLGSGVLGFTGNVGAGQMIDFTGNTGLLELAQPLGFAGTINGFGAGDTIDLTGMAVNGFSYTGNVLTLTESRNNSTSTVGHLTITGIANSGSLSLLVDGSGGTEIELLNPGGTFVPVGTIVEDDWTGGSGLWSTGSNWNDGVPGLNGEASFSSGLGTISVTYQSSGTINSIVQSDASASFDATGGTFAVLAGGVFDGAVTQAAAGVFDAIGGVLQFDGGGTLAGTLAGTGTIDLDYGTFTLAAGAALNVGTLEFGEPENAFADIVLKGNEAYAGSLISGEDYNGSELSLNGFNFTLANQAFLGGFEASGPGTLDVTGTAELGGVSLTGGAVLADAGSLTQIGSLFLGLSGTDSSAVSIAAHAIYDIVANAGIDATGTTSIVNAGLFEKTAGDGGAPIGAAFTNTSTGTIDAANGELALDDGGTLAGTLTGAGEIDLNYGTFTLAAGAALKVGTLGLAQPELAFTDVVLKSSESFAGSFLVGGDYNGAEVSLNGYNLTLSGHAQLIGLEAAGQGTLDVTGTGDVDGLSLTNAAVLLDAGSLTQDGNVTLGLSGTDSSAVTIGGHGVYDMVTNNTIYTAGTTTINNAGVFEKTAGSGTSVVDARLNTSSTIKVTQGVLQLNDGGSLGGNFLGGGEIDLNGGTFTFGAKPTVTVATLAVTGANLLFSGSLKYAGDFVEAGNSTLGLNGYNLTLSGRSYLDGATISGPGTLDLTGAATLGSVVLTGDAVLQVAGSLAQTGNLQLGVGGTDTALLNIAAGSSYDLLDDSGLYYNGVAMITNAGLLEKTASTGVSYVDAGFDNAGTVIASLGTLFFEHASNASAATLSGGTWGAHATLETGAALALVTSGAVSTDAADIILSGGGSEIYTGSAASSTIESSLTSIAATGTLQVLGGKDYVTTGHFVDSGDLIVGAGTFKAATLTISSGGSETLLSGGVTSGATIKSGGYLTVSSGGTSSNTHINGGTLEVKSGGASPPAVTFTGSGGAFIVDSKVMPSAVISGFVAGDTIKLTAVTYATSDTVSVKKAGVVTVSAGGNSYNLNIAGATVGETDFVFGSGSLLTKTTSAQMKFIAPQATGTVVAGGTALPSLAAVTAGNLALNTVSAAGQSAAASPISAHQPAATHDLLIIHRGGLQTLLAPHMETPRLF